MEILILLPNENVKWHQKYQRNMKITYRHKNPLGQHLKIELKTLNMNKSDKRQKWLKSFSNSVCICTQGGKGHWNINYIGNQSFINTFSE